MFYEYRTKSLAILNATRKLAGLLSVFSVRGEKGGIGFEWGLSVLAGFRLC